MNNKQSFFTETERQAIAVLFRKLMVADKVVTWQELSTLHELDEKYNLPYQLPDSMSYTKALTCLREMGAVKRQEVKDMMDELSKSDYDPNSQCDTKFQDDKPEWAPKEKEFLKLLFGEKDIEEHLAELRDTLLNVFEHTDITSSSTNKEMEKVLKKLDEKTPFRLGSEYHKHLSDIFPLCSSLEPDNLHRVWERNLGDQELEKHLGKLYKAASEITLKEWLTQTNYNDVVNYVKEIRKNTERILNELTDCFLQASDTNNNI